MTDRLDCAAGSCDYNSIIASCQPAALVGTANVKPGSTGADAGTVLVMGTTGDFAPAAAALDAESVALILAEDLPGSATAAPAKVYKCGCFVRNALKAGGSYSLAASDFEYLRQAGIQTEDAIY